jgi:hypothetical protein
VREALRTYTTAGAWQDHATAWKGPLTRGMIADICVLDGTLPLTPETVAELPGMGVAMTIFGGDVVYDGTASGARRAAAAGAAAAARLAGGRCAHGHDCCCRRAPELLAGRG